MRNRNLCLGSMVLGLHDAMVSALGLITGLAVAMADRYTIVLTVIIASITAAFSMMASQYLAEKANNNTYIAFRSGICTGLAYIMASLLQIMPFLIVSDIFLALVATYIVSVIIIFVFNYIKSRIKHQKFMSGFLEMLAIFTCVSVVAFIIGIAAKAWFGVDI